MIEINKLNFGYSRRVELFSELNLSLDSGGVCGLLGQNGAGKTSLLKIIAGLLFPQQGDCQIFDKSSKQRFPNVLENTFFISEQLYLPKLTIPQYLKIYAVFYSRFDHDLFEHGLNIFALPQNKLLSAMSYGQKKKFLIAFGLATRCRLLILDEPTNGLDIPGKSQFRKLIASSITDDQLIIISTHQVHDIGHLIDRIVMLDDANIILNATLEDINKKLLFKQQLSEPSLNDCIYYQKGMGGYTSVEQNLDGQESDIDLELLFNAVLHNKDNIKRLF